MPRKFKGLLNRLTGFLEGLRHIVGISVFVALAFLIGAIPVRAECWLRPPTVTIFDGAYPEAIFGYVFRSSGITVPIMDGSTRINTFGRKNIRPIVFCETNLFIEGSIGKVLFGTEHRAEPDEPL